jgi:thiol:disulfide interchange protein DsbD
MTRQLSLLPLLALTCVLTLAGTPSPAQDAKPQRKDTSDRLKPKEVVLTVKVSPERARPGDTVTYTVTAKVERPWHIYAYAKAQPDLGPRATQFDFFRTDGLKPAADWKPAKAPIRKKEPAFPDLDAVEFYETEASWSVTLQVPPGTAPGAKTLQSQVYFQICNDSVCKPPTYASVAPVTLTIDGGEEEARAAFASATIGLMTLPRPDDPAPRRKDTPEKLRPSQVSLTSSVTPAEAAPGQTVTFQVTARVEPGWHIYAYDKAPPDSGPKATQFDFFDPAGLEPVGDWTPTTSPTLKKEEAFPDLAFVAYHEGEVTWSQVLKVPADAQSGTRDLRCQVSFQICSDKECLPPTAITPSAATLKVLAESGTAAPEDVPLRTVPKGESRIAAELPDVPTKTTPVASSTPSASSSASGGAAQEKIEQGLGPFLLWSALGGVFALLMPCVWPMIPVTVNFFVKQGQTGKGKTTGLAITYCLAIIGIFTLVGLLFSAIFGASALTRLANNAWLNLAVGILFVVFGLSLLGLFEISLPSSLLNASSRGEGRGGLIGVVFMALTLTITSFTCTFPVVGALVVMAARGNFLYPVLGLATFATVLALPFFLLALSPGLLKKMPKSGDWMNTIKVIGGLVEIGAAFKFLNTAEIGFGTTPDNCWLDSEVLLAIWVVLSLVCGIYLLGLFKTDHDQDEVKVGPMRLLGGTLFIALALYLAPALFGYPPQSQIYKRLVVGILPADSGNLNAIDRTAEEVAARLATNSGGVMLAGDSKGPAQAAPARAAKATSSDPKVATREEKKVHGGIVWGLDYDAAVERAKAENRPILIDFTGVNCANCRLMEQSVIPHPKIVPLLRQFVTTQLYTDYVPIDTLTKIQQEELAEANSEREIDMTSEQTMPLYVIVTPDEKVVAQKGGYIEPDVFAEFLSNGLERAKGGTNRVASAGAPAGR